jgi:zinc protease
VGSLPKGKKASNWIDNEENIVKGQVQNIFGVDMQTPKSTVLQVYTADMAYTYPKSAAMEAISYIMDMRYVESLREEEGGTYGASTAAQLTRRPKERALIQVYFYCKPAICDKLRELAVKGLKDLAENGPTDEEVNMAKLNLQKNIPESRQRNNWWKDGIEIYLLRGEDRDALYEAAVNSLSKELIQETLKEVLAQNNFTELVMKPAATAEAE